MVCVLTHKTPDSGFEQVVTECKVRFKNPGEAEVEHTFVPKKTLPAIDGDTPYRGQIIVDVLAKCRLFVDVPGTPSPKAGQKMGAGSSVAGPGAKQFSLINGAAYYVDVKFTTFLKIKCHTCGQETFRLQADWECHLDIDVGKSAPESLGLANKPSFVVKLADQDVLDIGLFTLPDSLKPKRILHDEDMMTTNLKLVGQ
jgi:hypothetical protein